MSDPKCPKCGNDHPRTNCIHDFVPIEEQFLFTCPKCGCQYNFPSETDEKTDKRVEKAKQEIAEILLLVAQSDERYVSHPGYIRFGSIEKDLHKVVERLAKSSK